MSTFTPGGVFVLGTPSERRLPRTLPQKAIGAINISTDGRLIIAASKYNVEWWTLSSDFVFTETVDHYQWTSTEELNIHSFVFACNNSRAHAASNTGIATYVPGDDKPQLYPKRVPCMSIDIAQDAKLGICALLNGEIQIFKEDDPGVILEVIRTSPVVGISITRDGRLAMSCSSAKYCQLWSINTLKGQPSERINIVCRQDKWVWGGVLSENGSRAITCQGIVINYLTLWDMSNSVSPLKALDDDPLNRFDAFAISRDAGLCVLASSSGQLRVWNTNSGKAYTAAIFNLPIKDVALSSSLYCACGLSDGSIRLVDLNYEHRMRILCLTKLEKSIPSEILKLILKMIVN